MSTEPDSLEELPSFCHKTTGDVPPKLVGAATTVVGSKMYLFGGRTFTGWRIVAELYAFDLETYNWERILPFVEDDVPCARYFHSLESWSNQLIVFGGIGKAPDSANTDDLCVLNDVRFFDIDSRHWLPTSRFRTPESLLPGARYAQLSSVTDDRLFIIGGQDIHNGWIGDICVYDLVAQTWSEKRDHPAHRGSYRSVALASTQVVRWPEGEQYPITSTDEGVTSLTHLPWSAPPDDKHPSNIYLYTKYNSLDVTRELEVLSPLPNIGFIVRDLSPASSGTSFPPDLRFPSGGIQGPHLIVGGISLSATGTQFSFSIWALDLRTLLYKHIDTGAALETGSWLHGCLSPSSNKFVVFGNRKGNLVDDYHHRLVAWDDVVVTDLESFGIYQPPALEMEISAQVCALAMLEEHDGADFEVVCDDGRRVACSRKLLDDCWPWFKEEHAKLLEGALADPRLTAHALHLAQPYPVTLALVQYFSAQALLTPLQTAPAVLSQLLVLATKEDRLGLEHLASLVRHAMHRALSVAEARSESEDVARGVYEVAKLCGCEGLRVRATRTLVRSRETATTSPEEDAGAGGKGYWGYGGAGAESKGKDANRSLVPGDAAPSSRRRDLCVPRGHFLPRVVRPPPAGRDDEASALLPPEQKRPHPRIETDDQASRRTDKKGPGDITTLVPPALSPACAWSASDQKMFDDLFETVRALYGSSRLDDETFLPEDDAFGADDPPPAYARSATDSPLDNLLQRRGSIDSGYGSAPSLAFSWASGSSGSHAESAGPRTPGDALPSIGEVYVAGTNADNTLLCETSMDARLWNEKSLATAAAADIAPDVRTREEEEKRLKKEVIRGRAGELARTLRERSRVRDDAEENGHARSIREPVALFGGMTNGGLTM